MGMTSLVPRLTWMSVGRTNALRAGNLSSRAFSNENVACTPPHVIHNWKLHHMGRAVTPAKDEQVVYGRSKRRFRRTTSLSTRAPPVCPKDFFQFNTWICDQESFCICRRIFSDFSWQNCWIVLWTEQAKSQFIRQRNSFNSLHGFSASIHSVFSI